MMRRNVVNKSARHATMLDCTVNPSVALNLLLQNFVEGAANAQAEGEPNEILCCVPNYRATVQDGSEKILAEACGIIHVPVVPVPSSLRPSDTLIAAQQALATSATVESPLSFRLFTDDKALAHFYLSQHDNDVNKAAVELQDYAQKLWTKEILLGSVGTQELSPERQLQFNQLVDYWALRSRNDITEDVASRLLHRFKTLEAVEKYCQTAPMEQQQRLMSVLGAARELREMKEHMIPSPEAAAAALAENFAEKALKAKLDLSHDAVSHLKGATGIELDGGLVTKAQEILQPAPFVPSFSHPTGKSPVSSVADVEFEKSSLFTDDDLFGALKAVQAVVQEKADIDAVLKATIRSTKEQTDNVYLDYILNEFNYFTDVFDAENPVTATALPLQFFEALRSTQFSKSAVQKILDEACDQVAVSDPRGLGLSGDRFVSLYEMLDKATTLTIDFANPSQGFAAIDKRLSGSQLLAQRLLASELPYAGNKRQHQPSSENLMARYTSGSFGLQNIREKLATTGKAPRALGFEKWQLGLLNQIVLPHGSRKTGEFLEVGPATSQGTMPTLVSAVRDIVHKMSADENVCSPCHKTAPCFVLLHLNAADNLFLQMLHHKGGKYARSTAVKHFASSLTALFEAKHRLMWENIIMIPVVTGLSTDFCPELETLESNHYGFQAVLEQLRAQDPRRVRAATTMGRLHDEGEEPAIEIQTDSQGVPTMVDSKGFAVAKARPLYGADSQLFTSVVAELDAVGAKNKKKATSFARAVAENVRAQRQAEPLVVNAAPANVFEDLLGDASAEQTDSKTAEKESAATEDLEEESSTYRVGYASEAALNDAADAFLQASDSTKHREELLRKAVSEVGKGQAESTNQLDDDQLLADLLLRATPEEELPISRAAKQEQEQPVVGAHRSSQ